MSLEDAAEKLDIKGEEMKKEVRDIALLLREEINLAERLTLARRLESDLRSIKNKSMSEDAVFAATAGLKKPQKHFI